jgi:hypothetical protein
MNYYVIIGALPIGHPNQVIGYEASLVEFTDEFAGEQTFVKTPNSSLLLGYRYLGPLDPGITVLGADYLTQFEAPPAPGCYWNGEEWVCPPLYGDIAE